MSMRILAGLSALAVWGAGAGPAHSAGAPADPGDPPARVARLNYMSGSVSFRPGSVEDWTAAKLNYPLTSGDHLWTEAGARVEMHAGTAALRMASETAFAIVNLDDRVAQFSLTQGSLEVHIRDLVPGESFEVDTPNAAVSLLRPGEYRIDADGDNNVTAVIVRSGAAEFKEQGAAASTPAPMGQRVRISGFEPATLDAGPAPPPGEFDLWCETRDRREEQSQSARYVSRGVIGYEDLDPYGVWRNVPPYGWVWMPSVAVGWAPYRFGFWAWVDPWGWTWIEDEPWGFAPFHYGRWVFVAGGWAWIPGAIAPRPVYAPALVAFVGGAGFTAGVAWFPLGPAEVYRPAYPVSAAYIQQINVAHVSVVDVNVVNVRYVNRGVAGAVTVAPEGDFVQARPVGAVAVVAEPGMLARAQVVGPTALVAPRRESVLIGPALAGPHLPPARFAERATVTRVAPPPPPVPFRLKQAALQANPGRPLTPEALDAIRRTAPATAPQGGLRPAAPAGQQAQRPELRNERPPSAQKQPASAERPAPAPPKKEQAAPQQAPAKAPPAPAKKPAPKTEKEKKAEKDQGKP